MKKLFIIFSFLFSIFYFLFSATPTFAQLGPTKLPTRCLVGGADQVATIDCIPIIIGNVVFWLLVGAGILALVLIVISGFKFVFSGGDPKQVEGARKTLTWAIIGLVLILFSFAIVAFIARTTGVACITRFGFTQCVPADISQPCSRTNPDGFCTGGRECLPRKDRPGLEPSCQYRCSVTHHRGWCSGAKECTQVIIVPGQTTWICK
ncbi:MAG: hypothetical protein HYW63_01960 [Candidatus Levybacteria bacterium]|nr:hypothetical protein [Candidatus Levybacteria bacterium]